MMRSIILMLFVGLSYLPHSYAQISITPESKEFQFELIPFSAIYQQMGTSLSLETSRSADGKMYQVSMCMPDASRPDRIITDVLGLDAHSGAIVYRDFHLLMPAWSYNRMEKTPTSLRLNSYGQETISRDSTTLEGEVFDGTLAYWLLSGMSESVEEFKLRRWKYTPNGLEVGYSPTFKAKGREQLTISEIKYDCRIFSVEAAPGVEIVSYVSNQAPYLIKQVYKQGGQPEMEVLRLQKMK
ncbi:MAG: hypothetical protein F6K19_06800 [Cyanothece sp. SIO1E1]|nr:hypothetical protein [Cyanothece sp. SIO1E1]